MVDGDRDRRRLLDILLSARVNRYKAVVLDVLVDKTHDKTLADYGVPEAYVFILARTKHLKFVVAVALNHRRSLTHKHSNEVVYLELVANSLKCIECELKFLLGLHFGFGFATVVAVATVGLWVCLAKVVQQ